MNKVTLGYIKQAIISEIEGYEFYKMAASHAREDFVKESFLQFAEEERKHVEWLQGLFKQLDNGDHRLDLEMVDAPPSPELFKWENLDRENPQTTISVLGIALQMEQASHEFYLKVSETVEDKTSKRLFKILAAWEKAHHDMLNKDYAQLKNEWWSEQGFSPF